MIKLLRFLLWAFPFLAILNIGLRYIWGLLFSGAEADYGLLFGAVGISATLCALAFEAAGSAKDELKVRAFQVAGERLLHATLRTIVATILTYAYFQVYQAPWVLDLSHVLAALFLASAVIFFAIALQDAVAALGWMHKTLLMGQKDRPDDKILNS